MRKYYLFIIKKEYYNLYRNNSESLYKTLENLFFMKNNNISYGISIYNQICQTFNVDVLDNYFHTRKNFYIRRNKRKILVDSYLENERYIIELMYPCAIIYCNKNLPKVLKILNYYDPRIFICNFDNKDFFWNNNSHCHSYNYNFATYNLI